jgi:hypothetical protein
MRTYRTFTQRYSAGFSNILYCAGLCNLLGQPETADVVNVESVLDKIKDSLLPTSNSKLEIRYCYPH